MNNINFDSIFRFQLYLICIVKKDDPFAIDKIAHNLQLIEAGTKCI